MKILLINDLVIGGGVENVLLNITNYLSEKEEYQLSLLSLIDQKEEFKKTFPSNVRYIPYIFPHAEKYKRWSFLWCCTKGIQIVRRWLIKAKKYDVILALKEGPSMAIGAKMRAKQRFGWVHVDYRYKYWTKSCFGSEQQEVECMKKFNQIVCVSHAAKDSVCQVIGDPGNLTVCLNPVDVNQIIDNGAKRNQELLEHLENKQSNKPVYVAVGRLDEQKGYKRLLNVCNKLNEQFDYELWILGEGKQRKELEEQIKQCGMKNVRLWGNQSNPYPFIKEADWFVSGAIWESYGLALQEALVLGTPVFAATCEAFEECVSPEEAILVPNTEEALYSGLYELMKNPSIACSYQKKICSRTQDDMFVGRLKGIEELWKKSEQVH